jgi:hypothetical protein
VRIDLFLVIVDFGVRFRRWRLSLAHLHRRRLLLTGTLLTHAPGLRMTVRAVTLRGLLTSRFYIGERRPYEFAIHNASSKRIKKEKLPTLSSPQSSAIKTASRRLRPS